MPAQPLLAAIEDAGQLELAQLAQDTQRQEEALLQQAQAEALAGRQAAYQQMVARLASQRRLRLHQARQEAAQLVASAQVELLARFRRQIEAQLAGLRALPGYREILARLLAEAVAALGEQELSAGSPGDGELTRLEVAPEDEGLAGELLGEMSLALALSPILESWGGVILRSADGRIVINNTLEARLARIESYLPLFWAGEG